MSRAPHRFLQLRLLQFEHQAQAFVHGADDSLREPADACGQVSSEPGFGTTGIGEFCSPGLAAPDHQSSRAMALRLQRLEVRVELPAHGGVEQIAGEQWDAATAHASRSTFGRVVGEREDLLDVHAEHSRQP